MGEVQILFRVFFYEHIKNLEVCRKKKSQIHFYSFCYHETDYIFPTSVNFRYENTGLFKMIVRVLTTCHKQYT